MVSRRRWRKWIEGLAEINEWLEQEYWPKGEMSETFEWVVGQDKGLICRQGNVWYGGGESIAEGEGF